MNAYAPRASRGSWLSILGVALLGMLALGSAIGVVYCKHRIGHSFTTLSSLEKERDDLQIEWSKLLLEQGVLAADHRIDKFARERLHMVSPRFDKIVVVTQ